MAILSQHPYPRMMGLGMRVGLGCAQALFFFAAPGSQESQPWDSLGSKAQYFTRGGWEQDRGLRDNPAADDDGEGGSCGRTKQLDCRQGSSEGALCNLYQDSEAREEWAQHQGHSDLVRLSWTWESGSSFSISRWKPLESKP